MTIYNAGSKFPNSGGTFGAITLSGNGTISLSPSTTGSYAGILFVQPAANTQASHLQRQRDGGLDRHHLRPGRPARRERQCPGQPAFIVDTMTLSGNAVVNIVALAAPAQAIAGTDLKLGPASIRPLRNRA